MKKIQDLNVLYLSTQTIKIHAKWRTNCPGNIWVVLVCLELLLISISPLSLKPFTLQELEWWVSG